MNDEVNILITSVGRRSYLVKYFKDELGDGGEIHVANSTEITPTFKYADKHVVTPLIYDKDYITFLLNYCKKNSIYAIISLFDIDLMMLSKNKRKFEKNGIKLLVSDYEVIEKCNDKWKTFSFLRENGFNVPNTYLNINNTKKALEKSEIEFPLIIKPRWGLGSIGIYEADNMEELEVLYWKVKKEVMRTNLKYESVLDEENNVLIQEKLKGQEYGLDIINDLNCKYQNTIIKKKFAMRAGETDCAITVFNKELKGLGKKVSEKLKHIGNLDVDVFIIDDVPYILEMNARFGGGYPFSHMAGVNLPKALLCWLEQKDFTKDILQEKIGIMSHKDISLIELSKLELD